MGGGDEPTRGEDYPRNEIAADRELTPVLRAQMQEGEMLSELLHAVNSLSQRLMPVMSDEARKVDGGKTRISDSLDKAVPSMGSSPVIESISRNCDTINNITGIVRAINRNLEV